MNVNLALEQGQSVSSLKKVGYWLAALDLEFARKRDKTYLRNKHHTGPYNVQRPFYPEGDDCCHIYVLHPPGGMVSGDHLLLRLHCDEQAHVLATTPSANKVYACENEAATQDQLFEIGDGACLEFLPQEMILFNRSRSKLHTNIYLQGSARFIGWETITLGRIASGDRFVNGDFEQTLSIYRDEKLMFTERFAAHAQDPVMHANWGLCGYTTISYFVITGVEKDVLAIVQALTAQFNTEHEKQALAAVTLINNMLHLRILSKDVLFNKKLLEQVWEATRPKLLNKAPNAPRIWFT